MSDKPNIVGILRNWRKHICKPDGTFVVWGHVYDDLLNRFPDGHFIHTAKVEKIEGDLVYTVNNVYRLEGDPAGPTYTTYETMSA